MMKFWENKNELALQFCAWYVVESFLLFQMYDRNMLFMLIPLFIFFIYFLISIFCKNSKIINVIDKVLALLIIVRTFLAIINMSHIIINEEPFLLFYTFIYSITVLVELYIFYRLLWGKKEIKKNRFSLPLFIFAIVIIIHGVTFILLHFLDGQSKSITYVIGCIIAIILRIILIKYFSLYGKEERG